MDLVAQLRTRLYPSLGIVLVAPLVMGQDSGDSGSEVPGAERTLESEEVVCFARQLFETCPPPGAAAPYITGRPVDRHEGALESCELASVDGLDRETFAQCCYDVTLECTHLTGCGCGGRPLRVRRRVLTPPMVRARARPTGPRPSLVGLSATQRACLGSWWGGIGVSEHASVPSFERFARGLEAHRAPLPLRRAAARATRDEARHARLAFALAGAYVGAPMAAGAMDVPADEPTDLAGFAAATARDGGTEELRSLLVLGAMRERAKDPAVARVLDGMLRDELRHVELAWATVRWAARRGGDPVRRAVAATFAEAEPVPARWRSDDAMLAHGLIDRASIAGAFGRARAILEPIARTFAGSRTS